MPVWLIPLIWELIKLLPAVVAWIKSHPFASKREVIEAFPGEVKGLIEKLKEREKRKREGAVGEPSGLV